MDGELGSVGEGKRFICRFCKREFSKSQALGGHMNGHRQDRDKESYVKAKELLEQKGGSSYWMGNNQYGAPQNYSSISGGVQRHVSLCSPSQVQSWAQAGYSHSMSTYSNQNVGGAGAAAYSNQNAVGVGATSYLNQQHHAFAQNQGDHTDYQGRETYPSRPNYRMMETCQSLPYQRNNNLQMETSLLENSGISVPSLDMKSHLQMRGSYFQTPQGGNADLHVNGYAAASASGQQESTFPTSHGGNLNHGLNGYASASASEQQQPSFRISQGGNPDLHVNGYGVVSAFEHPQPTLPTSQGEYPNHGLNGYAAESAFGQQQSAFLTSQGGNPNHGLNGYASASPSEQQQPSFQTSPGGNPDLHVNGYGVVSAFEHQQPAFPTSQGGNPNHGLNGCAAASASGQHQQFFSVDHSHQPWQWKNSLQ